MSEFDRYLERLRDAGLDLSEDAERELRAHFDDAVADRLAAGRSPRQAELDALAELGRPDVVAAAFRREGHVQVRRFAGVAGALVVDAQRRWRLLLVSGALAAASGAIIDRSLPPTYEVRVPLIVTARMDFGTSIGVQTAFAQIHEVEHVPMRVVPNPEIEVSGDDRAATLARARAAVSTATGTFPKAFNETIFGAGRGGDVSVAAAPPEVEERRPHALAAASGALIGLMGSLVLAARTRRRGGR